MPSESESSGVRLFGAVGSEDRFVGSDHRFCGGDMRRGRAWKRFCGGVSGQYASWLVTKGEECLHHDGAKD